MVATKRNASSARIVTPAQLVFRVEVRDVGNLGPQPPLHIGLAAARDLELPELPGERHLALVVETLVMEHEHLIERTGAAGKFSVVPCPGACGRIDEGMPGVDDGDLAARLKPAYTHAGQATMFPFPRVFLFARRG